MGRGHIDSALFFLYKRKHHRKKNKNPDFYIDIHDLQDKKTAPELRMGNKTGISSCRGESCIRPEKKIPGIRTRNINKDVQDTDRDKKIEVRIKTAGTRNFHIDIQD